MMTIKRLTIILYYLTTVSLGLAACNSDDGDKNGTSSPSHEPRIPANAVQLTTTNAQTIKSLMLLVQEPLAGAADGNPEKIAFGSCVQSGGDDFSTKDAGTAKYTYTNCTSSGFYPYTVNGNITFSFEETSLTLTDHYILSGDVTLTENNDTLTITDIYVVVHNQFFETTVTISFAVSSQQKGGFIVKTSKSLTSATSTAFIDSGELVVQGAGNSKIVYDVGTDKMMLDNGDGVLTPVN